MLTVETTATYTATCETSGCTATWSGADPSQATGWVMTLGAWPISEPQPTSATVHCPTHASTA